MTSFFGPTTKKLLELGFFFGQNLNSVGAYNSLVTHVVKEAQLYWLVWALGANFLGGPPPKWTPKELKNNTSFDQKKK